jgi:hypothetical protein|tara:strand:- start:1140 stop:1307 length:168 start_codon:yes stop_codon:yes gene_type:complete
VNTLAPKTYEEAVEYFAKAWKGSFEDAIIILSNLYDVNDEYVARHLHEAKEKLKK